MVSLFLVRYALTAVDFVECVLFNNNPFALCKVDQCDLVWIAVKKSSHQINKINKQEIFAAKPKKCKEN